jgi:hypothetical protein
MHIIEMLKAGQRRATARRTASRNQNRYFTRRRSAIDFAGPGPAALTLSEPNASLFHLHLVSDSNR